jgi:hypothetical protein
VPVPAVAPELVEALPEAPVPVRAVSPAGFDEAPFAAALGTFSAS